MANSSSSTSLALQPRVRVIRTSYTHLICSNATIFGNGLKIKGDNNVVAGNHNEVVGVGTEFVHGMDNVETPPPPPPREKRKRKPAARDDRRKRSRDQANEQIEADANVARRMTASQLRVYLNNLAASWAISNASSENRASLPVATGLQIPSEEDVKEEKNIEITEEIEEKMKKEGPCVVCLSMPKTTVILDCKCKAMCAGCTLKSFEESMKCPTCRKDIKRGAVVIGMKIYD